MANYVSSTKPIPLVTPHPKAPLFSTYKEGENVIGQLVKYMSSNSVTGGDIWTHLRQAFLVSLWFALKYILGTAGPYADLNDDLHLDMANWRQSDACMKPGARGAGFVPRGWFKSTIFSHGADTWETVREPNICIRLESGIEDKAKEFLGDIKNTYERNEEFLWLFPECRLPDGWVRSGNWSSERIVVPQRTRFFTEGSVTVGSMTGASEGGHFDLYNSDDPIGLDDLDSQRSSGVDMYRKKNRFITNKTALLKSSKRSRIVLAGTRYAIDDLFDVAVSDAREFIGFVLPEFEVKAKGEWSIYNRCGVEDGVYPNPEVCTQDIIDKAMDEDPWFAMSQLVNYPQKTGLVEFHEYPIKYASMEWDKGMGDFVIEFLEDSNFPSGVKEEDRFVKLRDCDVVMSVDPAGTDKGMSAKTSRSSVGVWARDSKNRVVRIWGKVGYLSVRQLFDGIFEGHRTLGGYIRKTMIESNAMQKIVIPILKEEELRRGVFINPQPDPATIDKEVRIRNTVGSHLAAGRVYLVKPYDREFVEEKNVFPMSKYKMDVLDESEKGIRATSAPLTTEEKWRRSERDEEMTVEVMGNSFGY